MTPRPTPLSVLVDGIPDVLTAECRWANWRYESRDERWAKMQYRPSGAPAKSNDPATWTTFTEAFAAYQAARFDGVSFALGDGWGGIDVDNCLSRPHVGLPLLRLVDGYRETSPSGKGMKIIGRSPRVGGEMKYDLTSLQVACTTWTRPRFFTITGQASSGDPTADISTFIDARFPAPIVPAIARDGYADAATKSDDDLLLWMIGTDAGGVGDKILALWRGDLSAHGGDHSRADQALCCHLAFWTNYDAERMDRLFRQSGLMRSKWNTDSYRRATLGKALR